MPAFTFIALTLFIFLAIVSGIIDIMLEGRRIPAGSGEHNPATPDTAVLLTLVRKPAAEPGITPRA